jgi:hypothetical protein
MKGKKEVCDCEESCGCGHSCMCGHAGNGLYGLGFIGALVYYISTANGFWIGVLGVLKALVWPAFLVYNLLKFLLA